MKKKTHYSKSFQVFWKGILSVQHCVSRRAAARG